MQYEYVIKLQEYLSKYIVREDRFKEIRYIAGVDVSYRREKAYPCIVIIEKESLKMINYECKEFIPDIPYIPSLLFLREGNAMLSVLKNKEYDLIMVDGNGILHPRRFGLASYIGLMLNKPTIGVAKRLLCGEIVDDDIIDKGEVIGKKFNNIYISIGNMVSLSTAVRLVKEVCRFRLPEPIRLADIISRRVAQA